MKFLTDAVAKSLLPTASVIGTMKSNMQGQEKARCHKTVHASDVTKEDFCPRRVALLTIHDKRMPDQWVPCALRATFDMGNAISDLVREQWLGEAAVGNWSCVRCGMHKTMRPRPSDTADGGCDGAKDKHRWRYEEVNFVSKTTGISGSIDVLAQLGSAKATIVECKIISAEQFDTLAAPLSEHRIRTSLYMFLAEDSGSLWAKAVNTQQARVLYVSRGYGRKNDKHNNEILPFKEFVVDRDDAATAKARTFGTQAMTFFRQRVIPPGVCSTHNDPCATKCPVKKECFSGDHPAGQVLEKLP